MEAQYDLFLIKPDGDARWIGAAVNLEHAKKRLQELAQDAAGVRCFVREFCSGTVVAVGRGFRTRDVGVPDTISAVWRRTSMERFGLFEWRSDGFPHWVDAAPDLQQAKRKIQDWALESPHSEYFVQDFVANVVVASTRDYLAVPRRSVSSRASESRQPLAC
jgi:hypothetical protein